MPTLSPYKLGAPSSPAPLLPPLRSTPPASSSAAFPLRPLPVLRLQRHSRVGRPISASRFPDSTGLRELLDDVNYMSVRKVGHLDGLALVNRPDSCLCNKAVDKLINLEYSVSVIYSALSFFFAEFCLMGFQKFFDASRKRHLVLATKLMECQGTYRGKAKCLHVPLPIPAEPAVKSVYHIAMTVALSLEELAYEKLLELRNSARCCDHPDIENFIGSNILTEQKVEMINKISEYSARLSFLSHDDILGDFVEIDSCYMFEFNYFCCSGVSEQGKVKGKWGVCDILYCGFSLLIIRH